MVPPALGLSRGARLPAAAGGNGPGWPWLLAVALVLGLVVGAAVLVLR